MSSSSTQQEQSTPPNTKPDDSFLAIVILTIAIIVVISGGLYVWSNRYKLGLVEAKLAKMTTFNPPAERQIYISKKSTCNRTVSAEFNDLKKLLMKRALKTIPLLLTLQNEGNSVALLYKRGILTDDLHNDMKELKSFIDIEFQEVQNEAEELVEGWGQLIWPQAMQYHQMIIKQQEGKDDPEDSVSASADEDKKAKSQNEKKKAKKAQKSQSKDPVIAAGQDADAIRAAEAERIAKELIEEEEREKKKKNKANAGKNKK